MGISKRKILYVITKSNFGGAQRYVYELATSLPKVEYDVRVACGGTGVLTEKLRAANIPVFTIESFQRDINIKKEFQSIFELAQIIKSFQPDIIHLNSSKAGGTGALVSRILGVKKIIFTAHGWAFWEDRPLWWKSIVWSLSWITALLVNTIIVVSEYEHRRTFLPFTKHKFAVIKTAVPNIDFKVRDEARIAIFGDKLSTLHAQDMWAVSTSEHNQNKNLIFLLGALRAHNQTELPKIFLTLMGDGEDRELLEKVVEKTGIKTYVHFTGYVDNARSYLKAFDVFVIPSLKEGMPYGLIEAGAAGLAAIGSRVGGIPEIVEDHHSGILIDPKESETLEAGLLEMANLESRERFAQNLTEKVVKEFDLETMLQKTLLLYK